MSFIAYLCWLLGIAVPTDCDASDYGAWNTQQCGAEGGSQGGNVEPPKDEGQHKAPSPRRTNIDLSI